jgi:hypothetical protein
MNYHKNLNYSIELTRFYCTYFTYRSLRETFILLHNVAEDMNLVSAKSDILSKVQVKFSLVAFHYSLKFSSLKCITVFKIHSNFEFRST